MISVLRLLGVFLICLVAYNYINESIGLTIASSVALVLFGFCLIGLYRGYNPNVGMWLGWGLLVVGCLALSVFNSVSGWLLIPVVLFIVGYYLAGLPFSIAGGGDAGGGFVGGDGGCDIGDGGGD